jgi:hypothetical protein
MLCDVAGFPDRLVQALRRADPRALARQLEAFGDLEQRDAEGATLLMRACASPRATACVALLLERGAAIEASDPWQRTPLLFAVGAKARETVALLLERGAKADPREGLHRSTYEALPDLALVDLLLSNGARLEPALAGEGLLKSAWHRRGPGGNAARAARGSRRPQARGPGQLRGARHRTHGARARARARAHAAVPPAR